MDGGGGGNQDPDEPGDAPTCQCEEEERAADIGCEGGEGPKHEVETGWIVEETGNPQIVEINRWKRDAIDAEEKQFAAAAVIEPEAEDDEADDADNAKAEGWEKVASALGDDDGASVIAQVLEIADEQTERRVGTEGNRRGIAPGSAKRDGRGTGQI